MKKKKLPKESRRILNGLKHVGKYMKIYYAEEIEIVKREFETSDSYLRSCNKLMSNDIYKVLLERAWFWRTDVIDTVAIIFTSIAIVVSVAIVLIRKVFYLI